MECEERKIREAQWDDRTPLDRFLSLPMKERTAFLAFFAGARCNLQGSWQADKNLARTPSFGKAECEWVDFDFWRYKLPGLRLTTYAEGEPRCALGMVPGSVVWDITIGVTEDGWAARDAYLAT